MGLVILISNEQIVPSLFHTFFLYSIIYIHGGRGCFSIFLSSLVLFEPLFSFVLEVLTESLKGPRTGIQA
jgi:hypothetical protein